MKPIRQYEAEQNDLAKPIQQSWSAENEAWEAEKSGIINAIRQAARKGKDCAELKHRLTEIEIRKPEKPKIPRLLMVDSTSEALTHRLANDWPVAGMLSSEAGAVFGGHAIGKESVMRTLATFNA